jgi:DNA-binding response OmpR family regulator
MKLPYRLLVLDDDSNTLSGIVEMLRDAGYEVTGAATFDAAKGLLAVRTFDLFLSDVRLRGYNGLNLVRQSHIDHPEMSLIIMTGYDESMMEIEAGRYGAEFVRKPVDPQALLEVVARRAAAVRRERRSLRKRIIGGFRVVAGGRPAAVVDVSYGGLQLELPNTGDVPATFDVEVGGIGLHFSVDTVWSRLSKDGATMICGATFASDGTAAERTWRAIVDRLSA